MSIFLSLLAFNLSVIQGLVTKSFDRSIDQSEFFAKGLEKIFGAGAFVLEQHIIGSLYSRVGLKYEERKDYAFEYYVKRAKQEKDKLEP